MILGLARRSAADALADGAVALVAVYLGVLLALAPALSGAGMGAGSRVVADLGFGGTAMLVGAAGIGFGIRQVGVELRSRRALLVLSRPVPLGHWIAGRLVGVGGVLGGMTLAAGAGSAGIALLCGWAPRASVAADLTLAWAHAVVLCAAAMAASALARPAPAALAVAVLWLAAFLADDAAGVLGIPLLAWLVPTFDGTAVFTGLVAALGWSGVFGATATAAIARRDRG